MKQYNLINVISLNSAIVIVIVSLQFTGCTNYYLDKCQSTIIIPNSIPIPASDRIGGDIRYTFGAIGNPVPRIEFNNGKHTPAGIYLSDGTVSPPFSGNNVELTQPAFQGYIYLDYSRDDNFFFYSGINAGTGDDFMGAYYLGGGKFLKLKEESVLQWHFALNVYSQKYQASIRQYQPEGLLSNNNDTIFFVKSDSWSSGINIGLQGISISYLLNLYRIYGLNVQYIRYCGGTMLASQSEKLAFGTIIITPQIGLMKKIGNNQVVLLAKASILPVKVFPSIDINWTYCVRKPGKKD